MCLRTLSRYEEDVVDHRVPGLRLVSSRSRSRHEEPGGLAGPKIPVTHTKPGNHIDHELIRTQEGRDVSDTSFITTQEF